MRTAKRITRERLDITGRTFASTCFWVLLADLENGFAIDLEMDLCAHRRWDSGDPESVRS